jgi:hypothetical protein
MNRLAVIALIAGCLLSAVPGVQAAREECAELSLAAVALPPAVAGSPYLQQLKAYGGKAPVTFTIGGGALPAGLKLSPAGELSGVPGNPGRHKFTVIATDSCSPSQQASRAFTVRTAARGDAGNAGQPSVVNKAPLKVSVTPVPASIPFTPGMSGTRVTFRFIAKPAESAILESPGYSFLVNGGVVESVAAPLSAAIINGAAELAEEIRIPTRVLEAARRTPGATIVFSRAFMGRGTTAAAVVQFTPAAP